ncbi:MAG TPA: response regulator transcription factor [Pedococcus sp.]|nr:response regulator transcription factor [Pedococcus sp.]
MTRPPVRVLVADDQPVVRDGLSMLIGLIDGLDVVATAADGLEAVHQALRHRPDVVLMDLRMPHLDGTEATRRIRADLPDTQILVLTTYAEDADLFPALRAGARGYLTKDATAEQIATAITAVAAGQTHLAPHVQARLLTAVLNPPPGPGTPPAPGTSPATPTGTSALPDGLTAREAQVLALIAAGLSNTEIARTLFLSTATIKTHVNHIFAKTRARDRAQAVRYAYDHGIT